MTGVDELQEKVLEIQNFWNSEEFNKEKYTAKETALYYSLLAKLIGVLADEKETPISQYVGLLSEFLENHLAENVVFLRKMWE